MNNYHRFLLNIVTILFIQRPKQGALHNNAWALGALFVCLALTGCSRSMRSSSVPPPISSTAYYLDCSAGPNGSGTESSPWNSPGDLNALTFRPGDHLFVRRGTVCYGTLMPQGSGTSNAAIVIDAYGTGTQPVINGGRHEEALKLFNQQYWEINNLELTGGELYGLYISGDTPNSTLNHIYLRNLDVHGATFTSSKRADSGEVFISPKGAAQILNDVLIDHVTAHDSHVSEGIFVSAGGVWIEKSGVSQPLGNKVTVQNSIAHDIDGDGILIAELTNGLLQRNVVYKSGLCQKCTGSTPVGLWEWYCHVCTVQYNESYANQSWEGDGGDFDIDYFNDDNVVQYNYGHDSAGYCVAFFGAGGRASHNNIFRFNVCSNNGRRSDLSKEGEVFVHTWDEGSLDGVQIYNNTFYWNPAVNSALFNSSDALFSGAAPRFFKNNIIYATVPDLILMTSAFTFDNNIYWTTSASGPNLQFGGTTYTSFAAYQFSTKEDIHSYYLDPMVDSVGYHAIGKPSTAFHLLPGSPAIGKGANVCAGINGCSMGNQDFWGHPLPTESTYDIGAYQGPQ
jgi:hypothetical protein